MSPAAEALAPVQNQPLKSTPQNIVTPYTGQAFGIRNLRADLLPSSTLRRDQSNLLQDWLIVAREKICSAENIRPKRTKSFFDPQVGWSLFLKSLAVLKPSLWRLSGHDSKGSFRRLHTGWSNSVKSCRGQVPETGLETPGHTDWARNRGDFNGPSGRRPKIFAVSSASIHHY